MVDTLKDKMAEEEAEEDHPEEALVADLDKAEEIQDKIQLVAVQMLLA